MAEIDLPKPPKEGNGAPALIALTNQFNSLRKDCPFAIGALTRTLLVAQGRGMVRTEQWDLRVNRIVISSEPQGGPPPRRWNRGREPEDTNFPAPPRASWADLEEQAAKASNTLEAVKMALAQPTLNVEIDYARSYTIGLRHLQATRDATSWLALTALNDIHRRNFAAATKNILTIAALMRFQPDERFVDSQFTLWQTGLVGLDLTWEALQAPGCTNEPLAALQQTWQKDGVIQNTGFALEMERLFLRKQFEQVVHFPQWKELRRYLVIFAQTGDSHYSLRDRFSGVRAGIHVIAWKIAWADQDELRALQRYQLLLDRTRSAIARHDWSAYGLLEKDFPPTHNYYDRCRFLLSDPFTPDVERGNGSLRAFEFETQREMTVAAIAIKRYQLRTGKLPSDLAELLPEYLQQIPHDWMNGKPLRYHSNLDGTFTLYSVGLDGHDDGGDPTPIRGTRAYSIWEERDAVWPTPASSAEIDAAWRWR